MYSYEETSRVEYKEAYITQMKKDGKQIQWPGVFQVLLDFQGDTYMEITQTRAYDGQSLVGNAGGYIGLFLGVALIQLPTSIRYGLRYIRLYC